ncbi:MFS transporter [Microbacteriaceae bacterium VKM Ac-2854]|nr:MFS transporter [Microbacteriaceae bacterium VKM Ac-2854]
MTSGTQATDTRRGSYAVLLVCQLLAGLGVASGIAVAGLLAEKVSGSAELAGVAQTASILGAAIVAIPLARIAARHGRRRALALGYLLAFVGTVLVLIAVALGALVLLVVALGCVGAASAVGLQSRFAATELVRPEFAGRGLSVVMWATTLGSVAGPNLSSAGSALGRSLGLEPLSGPYLLSAAGFALAALLIATVFRPGHTATVPGERPVGSFRALRLACRDPRVLFATVAIIGSQMVMVGVMVMTPINLNHLGYGLDAVGIVISVHILGMYAASPIMGWLTDKLGGAAVIGIGIGLFAIAIVVGILSGVAHGATPLSAPPMPGMTHGAVPPLDTLALGLLGLGWSAGLIGGSALLTEAAAPALRVPLQGATDALMNYGAAGSAALSGLILGAGGVIGINLAAVVVLLPVTGFGVAALLRARRARA